MRPRLPLPRLRLVAALLFTFACDDGPPDLKTPTPDEDLPLSVQPVLAHADVEALPDSDLDLQGRLVFTPSPDAVAVSGHLSGLGANEFHAIHIHEEGDCSAPDGSSAGGHFAPDGHRHGAPGADNAHLGDLGNLTTGPQGEVEIELQIPDARMSGERGLVGRAVIVHQGHDDFVSQPSGAAGARIACGVIKHGAG